MTSEKVIHTKNSEETFKLGQKIAKDLKGGEVIALHGDLGSGKTVFAQGVAYGLGLRSRITSPTFLIIKHYPVSDHPVTDLYHADLYRISSTREVQEIGLPDMVSNSHAVTVIEWPEKMAAFLSENTMHITFLHDGEDNRLIIEGALETYIRKAADALRGGGIVIFPTDTAFGIGCRIDDGAAVEKLFTLRDRPLNKPTPVLFDGIDQVREYVREIPADVREDLMEKYWPGALTIVLRANTEKVTGLVRGGSATIGVRIPNNEITHSIIKEVGVPIIGTSANFHGKDTPYRFGDLDPKLCEMVDYVVPGVCALKKESTVIDCTVIPWKIFRDGAMLVSIEHRA